MNEATKNTNQPLVLFSITNGWGIRNFVYTGIFDAVSGFADIGVAVSDELYPFFQSMREKNKISYIARLPSKESIIQKTIRRIKKAIFQSKHNISTARIKWYAKANDHVGKTWRASSWAVMRTVSASWYIRFLEYVEEQVIFLKLPEMVRFPIVMVNCSPFDFRDALLMRFMHHNGARTIEIIPSWDNPSTKGCIPTCADTILVWGSNQKKELEKFYPELLNHQIRISGVPQFDLYYEDLPLGFDRTTFLTRLSIKPTCRVILYATCSEKLFRNEVEVVTDVAEAVNSNRFGRDVHLLIRCHPADRATRYEHLCSTGRVTIFPSSMGDKQNLYSWTPPEDETVILAATLKHCEVCINTASTMTLDAFACDTPVVNVAYDGKKSLPYLQSVRRYYDYHHYLPIALSGAVRIARSSDELHSYIDEALVRSEMLGIQRKAVLDAHCYHPDEGSVKSIVKEIEHLAQY